MASASSRQRRPADSPAAANGRGVWLAYDLGVRGDYEALYAWLDDHKAEECGESAAFFQYTYTTDLIAELTEDLKRSIAVTNATRIYAVIADPATNKLRGRFLIGSRRSAPCVGRGTLHKESQVDEG